MRTRKLGSLTTVLAIASVAGLAMTAPVSAGNVFLTGHDPDFHAAGDAGAANLLTTGLQFVTGGTTFTNTEKFLFVTARPADIGGVPAGHLDPVVAGLNAIGLTEGVEFDVANAAALPGVNFSNYTAIAVASSFGGLLTRAELDALILRKDDIKDFVNAGGGLFASSACDSSFGLCGANLLDPPAGDTYGYVPVNVSGVTATGPFTVTAYGLATFGLVLDDVDEPTHASFADASGLNIVDTDAVGNPTTLAGNVFITDNGFVPIFKEITSGPLYDTGDTEFVEVVDGIANGSFEVDVCTAPFDTENGPGGLTGWTIGLAGIDHICGLWDADDGTRSLDMSALNEGSVTQTLTGLTNGAIYQVTFGLAGNPGGPAVKDLRVSVDTGSPSADYTFNSSTDCGGACSLGNMGWTPKTYAFTANDVDADLTFASLTAGSGGPALDNVKLFEEVPILAIALAVEAPAMSSIHYDFKITANTEGLIDPVVYDTVPAEWTVTEIDEVLITGPDNNGNNDDNVALDFANTGVGCGGFIDGLGDGGDVTVSRGGNSKKNNCSSDTDIVWVMEPDEFDMIRVDLQSRGPKKNGKYKPTFCGALYLNYGAELMDGSTLVATSNRLVVASVFDLSNSSFPADGPPEPGDGVDPTGAGDEDQDGASDIDEVRNLGTDPCNGDTDDDGVLDGADLCPLQGVFGDVDDDGCPLV